MSFNTTRAVAIETEAVRGTAPATINYDMKIYNATPITPARETSQQGVLAGRKTTAPHTYIGVKSGSTTFDVDFMGSGSPTTPPVIEKLLIASGFADTGAGTTNEYTMDGTLPCGSLTYEAVNYECGSSPKGVLNRLVGAVPSLTISADTVGAVVKCNVSLTGGMQPETETTTLHPTTGNDTGNGMKFVGGVYTIGGTAVDIESFSFTTGAEVAMAKDATNTVNGIKHHFIKSLAGRQLTLTMKKPLISVDDWTADFDAETTYNEIIIGLTNGSVSATIKVTLAQAVDWSNTDLDSYFGQEVTFDIDTAVITLDA